MTMAFLKRQAAHGEKGSSGAGEDGATAMAMAMVSEPRITALAIFLGTVASIGGFMFGYVR